MQNTSIADVDSQLANGYRVPTTGPVRAPANPNGHHRYKLRKTNGDSLRPCKLNRLRRSFPAEGRCDAISSSVTRKRHTPCCIPAPRRCSLLQILNMNPCKCFILASAAGE